jgi:hypothetical protein
MDDDKTPVLQPCLACYGERKKRELAGAYALIECRWCTAGAMDQQQLLRYCHHHGITPKI